MARRLPGLESVTLSSGTAGTSEAAPARLLEESRAESLEEAAVRHAWPHSAEADWAKMSAPATRRIFVAGKGSTLWDVNGRSYLDALSGLFVVSVGHGRAEISEAMSKQAETLAYAAPSLYFNASAVELAERLAALLPADLNRVFFCSGGSESVETALKVAKQAQALRGFPKRYKVISRHGSYHGATYATMSLTVGANERFFGPFMHGVVKVPSPNHYKNHFGSTAEDGDLMCADLLEQEIVNQGPETVAAFIAEPISASNGTHIPTKAYWTAVREICDRHGVLLIMDEVITAFGRAGGMFASNTFDVVPDIMTLAKGLASGYAPIGAVAVRDDVFEGFTEPGSSFAHMLTFGGNATAAAAAKANLRIIEDEELVEASTNGGAYLYERAQELRSHPTVGDVRGGMGLFCGVELVKNRETKENWGVDHAFIQGLSEKLLSRGVLTRVWDVLHLAPPFVVSREEIDQILEAVDQSLLEVEREFEAEIDS